MKKLSFVLVVLLTSLRVLFCFPSEPFYYFQVPDKWKPVDISHFPQSLRSAFVAPSKKNFKPSINLAIEKIHVPMHEYIQAAKKQHTINRKNRWSEVGYISTHCGKAHVAQIESKTACGRVKMLQSILIQDNYAYILTSVASQEDFLDYHDQFLEIFKSLKIYPSLEDSILEPIKQKKLQDSLAKLKLDLKIFCLDHPRLTRQQAIKHKDFIKKHLKPFDHLISSEFNDLGLAWNVLANQTILHSLENDL